jgi:hypothetical protein
MIVGGGNHRLEIEVVEWVEMVFAGVSGCFAPLV